MRRFSVPALIWVAAVLALLVGLGLVATAQWSRPLVAAEQASAEGRLEEALKLFAEGEARFNRVPTTKQMLPSAYEASIGNQLAIQYKLHRLDELLDKAAASPSMAATHFWSGCALFSKSLEEEGEDDSHAEARIGWLTRAEQEFRKALEFTPNDWDTKYNYELASRLLDELRKQPKTPPRQLLKLLRPQPKTGGEPTKRVG